MLQATSYAFYRFKDVQQAGGMTGFVPTGISALFNDAGASRCRLDVQGELGHNTEQVITHLTLLRNGMALPGAGESGLAAPRSKSRDAIEPSRLFVVVEIPQAIRGSLIIYEVAWWTLAGTAFMGRRPIDFLMYTEISFELTGLP